MAEFPKVFFCHPVDRYDTYRCSPFFWNMGHRYSTIMLASPLDHYWRDRLWSNQYWDNRERTKHPSFNPHG